MPKLKPVEIDRIYLPSTADEPQEEQIFIDCKKDLTVGDLLVYDKNANELENAIRILSRIIVAWNITGDDDNVIEINPNTIEALPARDLNALVALVEGMIPDDLGIALEEKKT